MVKRGVDLILDLVTQHLRMWKMEKSMKKATLKKKRKKKKKYQKMK